MSENFEHTFWKGKATDIAYKSPFSDNTNKIRTKLLLFSFMAILNFYFPLDFNSSQIFGVKFKDGNALSLSGMFSLLVLYFAVILIVHTYQEVQAWLAQANSLEFAQSRRNLNDVYAHHQSIGNAISGANEQLAQHNQGISLLNDLLQKRKILSVDEVNGKLSIIEVHRQSFENYCSNLGKSNVPFGEEIEKAINLHKKSFRNYRAAMLSQVFKVGILEIIIPFTLAAISIYLSYEGVLTLIKGFIK
jgi:hypothetical protein